MALVKYLMRATVLVLQYLTQVLHFASVFASPEGSCPGVAARRCCSRRQDTSGCSPALTTNDDSGV